MNHTLPMNKDTILFAKIFLFLNQSYCRQKNTIKVLRDQLWDDQEPRGKWIRINHIGQESGFKANIDSGRVKTQQRTISLSVCSR